MLLTGTHPRTLDDKKRLALPKKVREQLGETQRLFVTPGADQSLWLYDPAGLENLAAKLDQAPATDSEARVFRRLFFAQMEEVDVDGGNRILIPERLLQFASLEREVVLLGVRDHLELWSAQKWQDYRTQHEPRFDAVAEKRVSKERFLEDTDEGLVVAVEHGQMFRGDPCLVRSPNSSRFADSPLITTRAKLARLNDGAWE